MCLVLGVYNRFPQILLRERFSGFGGERLGGDDEMSETAQKQLLSEKLTQNMEVPTICGGSLRTMES